MLKEIVTNSFNYLLGGIFVICFGTYLILTPEIHEEYNIDGELITTTEINRITRNQDGEMKFYESELLTLVTSYHNGFLNGETYGLLAGKKRFSVYYVNDRLYNIL